MANFGGVYFLPFFPKTPLSASKLQFYLRNPQKLIFFQEIAILRHLEWFLEKMAESKPPLFFNFIFSTLVFLTNFFFLKVTGTNLSLPKQASRHHNFKTVFNGSDTIRVLVTYRRSKGRLMDTDTM